MRAVRTAAVAALAALAGASWPASTSAAPDAPGRQVLQWGLNGDYGLASSVRHSLPTPLAAPLGARFVSLSSGEDFTLGLTSSGTVYAWGDNSDGQLGDGSTTSSQTPVAVALPRGVDAVAIAAGGYHALAVSSTGTVYAWGANYAGQLGDGSTTSSQTPVAVALPGGATARAVAAGGAFSMALTTSGAIDAWGDGANGELGDKKLADEERPVAVHLPSGEVVSQLAAGAASSFALTTSGRVLSWGYNANGELGDGRTKQRLVPGPVTLPTGTRVTSLSAGAADAFALVGQSTLLGWGRPPGSPASTPNQLSPAPVPLPAGTHLVQVAAGQYHVLARTSSGGVLSWGDNRDGQLGDGSLAFRARPGPVTMPQGALAVTVGSGATSDASAAVTRAS